jgi:hypothetical protein
MEAHLSTVYNNNNDNKHAYAGQLNSFTHIRALFVLHDRGINLNKHAYAGQLNSCTHLRYLLVLELHDRDINLNKHAYAGQLNSFTHLRTLSVYRDRGIEAHTTSVAGHYSSN